MFREKYREHINWGVTVLCILVLAISCYFLFLRWNNVRSVWGVVTGILAPVSIGLMIAYILDSLVAAILWLLKRIPVKSEKLAARLQAPYKAVAIAVSEITLLAVITILIQSIVPQVLDSLSMLISNIDTYAANLEAWGRPLLEDYPTIAPYVLDQLENLEAFIKEFLKNDLFSLLTNVTSGLIEVGSYVYNFIIGVIVSIYLLSSKNRLLGHVKKLLYTLVRPVRANRILEIARYTNRVFKGFLVGKLLDSIIIGVLCFLGTTAFSIPYSLLISIVVGVTNIIPYFGPFIGAIPSALLVLMLDPGKCLIFVIFIIVLQQIDGNVIGPKILGNTTGVSSLGVLISILIGGGLFGLTGMIFSVPTFAVVYSLVKNASERRLRSRGLPVETADYISLDQVNPDTLEPSSLQPLPRAGRKKR